MDKRPAWVQRDSPAGPEEISHLEFYSRMKINFANNPVSLEKDPKLPISQP